MIPHRWTDEQIEALRALYRQHPISECCRLLNLHFGLDLKVTQVKAATANHRIKSGRTGRFEKGQESWNKGGRMPFSENNQRTQFQPGGIPHNHRPIGSTRFSKEGYLEVKVGEPNVWKGKHRLLWEEAYGPIPKGYNVVFLDQDKQHLVLENLRLVKRQYMSVANRLGLIRQSAELTETGLLVAEVKVKTSQAKRKLKEERRME